MTRFTRNINIAAKAIREGKIVAFPTDTVFGLGTNAYNEKAVSKIYKIKNRNKKKPLIINIVNLKMIEDIVITNKYIKELVKIFWPGQVTIIFKKKKDIIKNASARTATIGVRMPDCKITLDLIKKAKCPIISTSANIEGQTEPVFSYDIDKKLLKKIDIVLTDDFIRPTGKPSSIIDFSSSIPKILRHGDNKIDRKLKKFMIKFNTKINL